MNFGDPRLIIAWYRIAKRQLGIETEDQDENENKEKEYYQFLIRGKLYRILRIEIS